MVLTRSQARALARLIDPPEKKVFRPISIRPPGDFSKLATFDAIPTSVLQIIQLYLNKYDYRQLLNTNAAIFQHVKYETVYYNFVGYEQGKKRFKEFDITTEQADYFTALYSSVKDKSKQISLHVEDPTRRMVKEYGHFMTSIHHLTFTDRYFPGGFWSNDTDMNTFCNIYHLTLTNVEDIECLQGLSGIKILEVSQSRSLVTIEYIEGLKRLVVIHLSKLCEIVQWDLIPELIITGCHDLRIERLQENHNKNKKFQVDYTHYLTDYTCFKNVSCLSLMYLPNEIDFHLFFHLTYLSLNCFNFRHSIFDPSPFNKLRCLSLGCAKIVNCHFPTSLKDAEFVHCEFDDVSIVSHVQVLTFLECFGVGFKNINSLSSVRKLIFTFITELKDVSALGGLHELSIIACEKVKNISKLGRVHRLKVSDCGVTSLKGLGQGNSDVYLSRLQKTSDFSALKSVYKVSLDKCDTLVDGRDLANVQHLTISRCNAFEDTSALSKVKSLSLVDCPKIAKLVGLENVPHVNIELCNELRDISCLGKQQSLIISDCRRLRQLMKEDQTMGMYSEMFHDIPFVRLKFEEDSRCSSIIIEPRLYRDLCFDDVN